MDPLYAFLDALGLPFATAPIADAENDWDAGFGYRFRGTERGVRAR